MAAVMKKKRLMRGSVSGSPYDHGAGKQSYNIIAPKPTATRLSLHFAAGPCMNTSQLRGFFSFSAPSMMPAAFHLATDIIAESQSTVAICQHPTSSFCYLVRRTCKESIDSHEGIHVREALSACPHRNHDEVDDSWGCEETLRLCVSAILCF